MACHATFVTSYIDCERCLAEVVSILVAGGARLYERDDAVKGTVLPATKLASWALGDPIFPVVAGVIETVFRNDAQRRLTLTIIPRLSETLCHRLRIAVLGDPDSDRGDDKIFTVEPVGRKT
jgi:hypothetical protein